MCIEYIHRHIREIPASQIFTTREMLIYGRRSAIDAALSRMVKSHYITRLARGVFIRDDSREPSLSEIVEAKAAAYGTKIVKHADSLLQELKLRESDAPPTFAIRGSSRSFWTVRGRAHLREIGPKKLQLSDTKVGQIVYALWQLGPQLCTKTDIRLATSGFGRSDRRQLWLASS